MDLTERAHDAERGLIAAHHEGVRVQQAYARAAPDHAGEDRRVGEGGEVVLLLIQAHKQVILHPAVVVI